MKKYALAILLPLLLAGCSPETKSSIETRDTPSAPEVQTATVEYQPIEKKITLVGQVDPTEHGRADVTTPLQGVVIQPLVKVGQHVDKGFPLAQINSVYGQTPMQLQQKLDTDRAAVVSVQNSLQLAISTLGQARATLAQARMARSQALDNLFQSQAELANATKDTHRKQELLAGGVASQADVDDAHERLLKARAMESDMAVEVRDAREGVTIAQGNVGPAEENVRLCRINISLAQRQVEHDQVIAADAGSSTGSHQTQFYVRSPMDGTVIAVNMSAGLSVAPGTILASVVNTTTVYVDSNAYEGDLPWLHRGDPLQVHADGFPDETFSGRVSYVGRQVDPNSRTVAVRCLIPNRHDALRPGLFVQAVLSPTAARRALVVPNQAVLLEQKQHYVVVQSPDGKFDKRPIREGIRTDTVTEVLDGLKVGEHVVTEGNILVIQQ